MNRKFGSSEIEAEGLNPCGSGRSRFFTLRKELKTSPTPEAKIIATVFLCTTLLFSGQAQAQTTTIDFDPPAFFAGEVLTTVGDVTFPDGPVVFTPPRTTTFSPPNALRSAQPCNNKDCSNGAYMLRMNFAKGVSMVSLRAGSYGATIDGFCFPENTSCNVTARLIGFDTNGNGVADSGDVKIGDYLRGAITAEIKIANKYGLIRSAVLFCGKGTRNPTDGGPAQAQIDHLVFTVPGNPPPPPIYPPPSVTITSPQPQQSFSYPYKVTFTGKVIAAGGLFAFGTAINNSSFPPENQCTQVGAVGPNGDFSFTILLDQLQPGTNTLYAFAYDLEGQRGSASVQFFLQPPPPPTVTIEEPVPGQEFKSSSNITELGTLNAPGGLLSFCVGANESSPPSTGQCNQIGSVTYFPSTAQGFFEYVPVPRSMLVPGLNTLDAWVYDRWGQLGQAHVAVQLPADPQVIAMEVTQGIQTTSIPVNAPGSPVIYSGVKLYEGGKTIVRVFANTVAGTLPDVPCWLWGFQGEGNQRQDLGLIFPDNGPQTLVAGGTSVSLQKRADPNGAYVFTLPWSWTTNLNGPLTLQAVLYSSDIGYSGGGPTGPHPTCPGCQANSAMTLTNINFENLAPITIFPVEITWTDPSTNPPIFHAPNPNLAAVFAQTASISPLSDGNLIVLPYQARIDISDLVLAAPQHPSTNDPTGHDWLRDQVLGEVSAFGMFGQQGFAYIIGVIKAADRLTDLGVESLEFYPTPFRFADVAVVNEGRPLTSVTHEFFHQLHYYHAGMFCYDRVPGDAFPAVSWPPDERGDIQGIGLDRRSGSGSVRGTYRIIAPGAPQPGQLPEVVDFMSYCAAIDDSNSWISVRNWNTWGSSFPNGLLPCDPIFGCATAVVKGERVPPGQQTLRVTASVDPSGKATILRVEPGDGREVGTSYNSTDQAGYNWVVRDSAGQIVSSTPVTPVASDGWFYLSGEVLASNATSIEIQQNGSVKARRDRSPHAPTVTLLLPDARTQLSGKSATLVKWQAEDADGDPLSTTVEYSADDGETYRVLTTGVIRDNVSLPGSLFSRSNHARIRVRVNDGFNEALAVSERLSAEGSPPTVNIWEPERSVHYRNDVALRFAGKAYDDAGRPLPADALRWYDGDRFLGEGPQLSSFDREPGHRTIKLVARDDDRESVASVEVYIDAVAPAFVGLQIPDAVDHREDELRLVLGSSVPGVVVIGDRSFPVDIKPKQMSVPIHPGKEEITLPLVLVAEGKTTTFVAHIKRN